MIQTSYCERVCDTEDRDKVAGPLSGLDTRMFVTAPTPEKAPFPQGPPAARSGSKRFVASWQNLLKEGASP
jgi:hypothetical protein